MDKHIPLSIHNNKHCIRTRTKTKKNEHYLIGDEYAICIFGSSTQTIINTSSTNVRHLPAGCDIKSHTMTAKKLNTHLPIHRTRENSNHTTMLRNRANYTDDERCCGQQRGNGKQNLLSILDHTSGRHARWHRHARGILRACDLRVR